MLALASIAGGIGSDGAGRYVLLGSAKAGEGVGSSGLACVDAAGIRDALDGGVARRVTDSKWWIIMQFSPSSTIFVRDSAKALTGGLGYRRHLTRMPITIMIAPTFQSVRVAFAPQSCRFRAIVD